MMTPMRPRIVAIAGPLKGTIFELSGQEVSIGRDPENVISIPDKSISRRHCVVVRDDDGLWVRDSGSRNGISVNGVPVNEHPLQHGDRLKVGGSHLVVLLRDEAEAPATNAVRFDVDVAVTGGTVRLRLEDALYRMARDLGTLMRIAQTLSAAHSFEELQSRLLGALFEIIPAERGAILLATESLEEWESTFAAERLAKPGVIVNVSRTVTQQVLREKVALLSYDILEDVPLSEVESLRASAVRSLLCIPLLLRDRATGVIYLSSSNTNLNEGHLQLASAVASFAAGTLENACRVARLQSENERLRGDVRIEHNMVGESPKMREVYRAIAKAAPAASTVLLRGESGTGKELAARAVHHNSPRVDRPFVAINCAAITETLLESELFGYEKGAFTGAAAQMKGKLEAANGGTIFLDEVGEMSLPLQAKVLRVLQEREFERVGGTRSVKVDLRVIAATNRDLEKAVAVGGFRQDLYYRLNVITITLPPLRERVGDVGLLARYFAEKHGERCKRPVTGLSPESYRVLLNYDWPGNIRELENAIERAVVLGSTEMIVPEDLPENVLDAANPGTRSNYYEAVREAKRQVVLRAIDQAGGSFAEAARLLGIHPNNLHRLIRNLSLRDALSR